MKTEYGGISEMVERPDWDDSKTKPMLNLLKALKLNISKVEKELNDHVRGKFG